MLDGVTVNGLLDVGSTYSVNQTGLLVTNGLVLNGTAYANIFAAIRLKVTFSVDELVIAGNDTAYALTRSNGEVTILTTGSTNAEANREVFSILRVGNRYSTTFCVLEPSMRMKQSAS